MHITQLENRYIRKYLPANPELQPSEYEYDVKAFCLFSHAALENYFETIAEKIMIDSIEQWKLSRKISPPLITLLAYSKPRLTIDMNENNRETIVFDYLRRQLESVQKTISTYIRVENHGIALKHLRQMLIPVSINIMDDARILNSLKRLSQERGGYAHRPISKFLSPEDSQKIVNDCLDLCGDIQSQAVTFFS